MIFFVENDWSKFSHPHIPCGLCFKFLTFKPYLYYSYSEKYEHQLEYIFSTNAKCKNSKERYVFLVLAEDNKMYYLDVDDICFNLFAEFLFTNARIFHGDIDNQRLFIRSFLNKKTFCTSRISINNSWPHFYISQISKKKIALKKTNKKNEAQFVKIIDKYVNEELKHINVELKKDIGDQQWALK